MAKVDDCLAENYFKVDILNIYKLTLIELISFDNPRTRLQQVDFGAYFSL